MRPVLADFMGHWTVTREIREANGTRAAFRGTAHWTPEGPGALYSESGHLSIAGAPPFLAERRYRWDADLNVSFDDGSPFHQVDTEGQEITHICPPDTYRGHYDFTTWPQFRLTWRVTGPRKDYVSVTCFSR